MATRQSSSNSSLPANTSNLSNLFPMSGHSKWKQIKQKKGAADVKRGKLFSQISKLITVSARTGQNLDMVIERAKAANMPAENIDRAIKKGTGELADGIQIESLVYEAYGPGGAALLVTVVTDNRNRSSAELRAVLNKLGGRLAEVGSVQYLFDRKGAIEVALDPSPRREHLRSGPKGDSSEVKEAPSYDELELLLIDAGADDLQTEDDRLVVFTQPTDVGAVRDVIKAAGFTILDAKLVNVAKLTITLSSDDAEKLLRLMEAIDELDDVESVETNADLSA